jgi:uncharacterized protein YceK
MKLLLVLCIMLLAGCQSSTRIDGAESTIRTQTTGYRVTYERALCGSTTVLPAPEPQQWRILWTPPAK